MNKYKARAQFAARKPRANAKWQHIIHRRVLFGMLYIERNVPNDLQPRIIRDLAWKKLGRSIAYSVHEVNNRKGFVRSLFEQFKPDTTYQVFTPESILILDPVPNFVVELVDQSWVSVGIVESEELLALYADIQSRMPQGLSARNGDYPSFDPTNKDGDTGSEVRIVNGKIVEVRLRDTQYKGPYRMFERTEEKIRGWEIWDQTPMTNTLLGEIGTGRKLAPGEAMIFNSEGTFTPFPTSVGFMGKPKPSEITYEITLTDLPMGLSVPKPDPLVVSGVVRLTPDFDIPLDETEPNPIHAWLKEWKDRIDENQRHYKVTPINDELNLITDVVRYESELRPSTSTHGCQLVESLDLKTEPGPHPVIEGDEEVKTGTVNDADTNEGTRND